MTVEHACGLSVHRDHNSALEILNRVPPVGREFTRGESPPPGREIVPAGATR
jgi:hypothetical protein